MHEDSVRLSVRSSGPGSFQLIGELDAYSCSALDELATQLTSGDDQRVELDMSRVEFMDSSGLRSLIELHNRTTEAGRRLIVRAPSHSVTRLFEISGLDDVFEVEPSS